MANLKPATPKSLEGRAAVLLFNRPMTVAGLAKELKVPIDVAETIIEDLHAKHLIASAEDAGGLKN